MDKEPVIKPVPGQPCGEINMMRFERLTRGAGECLSPVTEETVRDFSARTCSRMKNASDRRAVAHETCERTVRGALEKGRRLGDRESFRGEIIGTGKRAPARSHYRYEIFAGVSLQPRCARGKHAPELLARTGEVVTSAAHRAGSAESRPAYIQCVFVTLPRHWVHSSSLCIKAARYGLFYFSSTFLLLFTAQRSPHMLQTSPSTGDDAL